MNWRGKFEHLEFEEDDFGIMARVKLDNGIEVTVIQSRVSYGGASGLFEIGAHGDTDMIHIERWGDQVKGWLTPEGGEKEIDYLVTLDDNKGDI